MKDDFSKLDLRAGKVLSAAVSGAVKSAVEEVIPAVEEAAGISQEDKKGGKENK